MFEPLLPKAPPLPGVPVNPPYTVGREPQPDALNDGNCVGTVTLFCAAEPDAAAPAPLAYAPFGATLTLIVLLLLLFPLFVPLSPLPPSPVQPPPLQ
jgi:hypothetical protein